MRTVISVALKFINTSELIDNPKFLRESCVIVIRNFSELHLTIKWQILPKSRIFSIIPLNVFL